MVMVAKIPQDTRLKIQGSEGREKSNNEYPFKVYFANHIINLILIFNILQL